LNIVGIASSVVYAYRATLPAPSIFHISPTTTKPIAISGRDKNFRGGTSHIQSSGLLIPRFYDKVIGLEAGKRVESINLEKQNQI
jgi:hypothetical protein